MQLGALYPSESGLVHRHIVKYIVGLLQCAVDGDSRGGEGVGGLGLTKGFAASHSVNLQVMEVLMKSLAGSIGPRGHLLRGRGGWPTARAATSKKVVLWGRLCGSGAGRRRGFVGWYAWWPRGCTALSDAILIPAVARALEGAPNTVDIAGARKEEGRGLPRESIMLQAGRHRLPKTVPRGANRPSALFGGVVTSFVPRCDLFIHA